MLARFVGFEWLEANPEERSEEIEVEVVELRRQVPKKLDEEKDVKVGFLEHLDIERSLSMVEEETLRSFMPERWVYSFCIAVLRGRSGEETT